MQKIRTATFEDLDAIAAVEAACFPAAEAATKEEFAGRLTYYADHFWLLFEDEKLVSFVDGFVTDTPRPDRRDVRRRFPARCPWGVADDLWGEYPARIPEAGPGRAAAPPGHRRCKGSGPQGLVLTCKDRLVHYYAGFGFVSEGVSGSTHGGVVWYQMRLTF